VPKLSIVLGLLVTLLLAIYAVGTAIYIVPVYQSLMYGLGASFSLPARLSMAVGQYGVIVVLLALGAAVGLWRAWKRRDATGGSVVLSVANLILVGYVVLQAFVFVDFAISVPARFQVQQPAESAQPPTTR
jgi:hypothetical protein